MKPRRRDAQIFFAMTRLQADILLLLAALIWGAAFVAQKEAMEHMGPFTFIAARFGISALLVLPFALREGKKKPLPQKPPYFDLALLGAAFCAGVILQQVGIERTSVTNAGFLTGLYVVFVPLICTLFYKEVLPRRIFPAALMAIGGVWLLSGSTTSVLDGFSAGDGFVLMCAAGFALQVVLVGRIMQKWQAPLRVCVYQYAIVTAVALTVAFAIESPSLQQLHDALWPVLYAGAISGGVAYTLQVVAQQYTPASDSAVLLSSEAVFAALFGWLMAGDRLSGSGWLGCLLITLAIIVVEIWPYISKRKT